MVVVKVQAVTEEEEELQGAAEDKEVVMRWRLRRMWPWRKRRSYRQTQRTTKRQCGDG